MASNTQTIAYGNRFAEEFPIPEDELIESDGAILKSGDFVTYLPEARHHSRTETGCLLIRIDHDGV